jgi:hypothetical protein
MLKFGVVSAGKGPLSEYTGELAASTPLMKTRMIPSRSTGSVGGSVSNASTRTKTERPAVREVFGIAWVTSMNPTWQSKV